MMELAADYLGDLEIQECLDIGIDPYDIGVVIESHSGGPELMPDYNSVELFIPKQYKKYTTSHQAGPVVRYGMPAQQIKEELLGYW